MKQRFKELQAKIQKLIDSANGSSMDDYDKAGWPYYRADKDGQIKAYKLILHLIDKELDK